MYKILFILLMSTFFSVSSAQNIVLTGEVINPITNDKNSGAVFNLKISSAYQDVVLIVSASGYDSVKKNIHIDSEKKRIDVGTINLLPVMKERNLNEATVTATKIKMYYKGDTLVYNADAFNILIYVNGKAIESLLFSGKDFFNGNIDAALDRLPAYIVSKLKVYDKQGELSELTGRDMHDKQYVMDVHLKREYLGTWMAKLGRTRLLDAYG